MRVGDKILCVRSWNASMTNGIIKDNIYTVMGHRSFGEQVTVTLKEKVIAYCYDYPNHNGRVQFKLISFKLYAKEIYRQ